MTKIYLLLTLSLLFCKYTEAEVITYKQPDCTIISHIYEVQVRDSHGKWQNTGVYNANIAARFDAQRVTKKTSFTYFDCSDSVSVRVKVNYTTVREARIRPSSRGIIPKINGNIIEFSMKSSEYLSLEINGDVFENLQLFADTIEKERPNPNDPNVIYFGPGIHNIGRMTVPSNKTIYIAGGAVVIGELIIDHVKNVNIRGRGILTQLPVQQNSSAPNQTAPPQQSRNDQLLIQFSENIKVSGIIEMPKGYAVLVGESKNIHINNFKAFSSTGNADGIDIFCSKDVTINHIFLRNSDDCIAIYGHRWNYYGNTTDITINNATLWADVAHPLLIGTHGDSDHPDTLQNIKLRDMTVLDHHENQLDYQGCIALNAGDSNLIRNISFENVNIGDIRKGQLFNLRIMFNRKYNTSPGGGIENILFKNVTYAGSHANMSVISGYDDQHAIKNVTFENLTINGTLIYDTMKGKPGFYKTGDMANIFIGEHVDGIKFVANK
jgi:hypothetical protein